VAARSAVRLTQRQFDRLVLLESERLPIAEIHRRWAGWAEAHGLPRPSYERTRTLVHELRELDRERRKTRDLAFEVAFARGNPYELERRLTGT
jgi:hypothetical protein